MATIEIVDPRLVNFIVATTSDMVHKIEGASIEVSNEVDQALLERLRDGRTSLLRYSRGNKPDLWMLTGFDGEELVRSASRLKHFLTPSYGKFTHDIHDIQGFDSRSSKVQSSALELNMPGFYRLETNSRYRSDVLHAIRTWIKLEEDRPIVEHAVKSGYRDLLASFQRALATSSWCDAEEHLNQISHYRLTSAENITFLEIRLLTAQGQWKAIWESARYTEWAQQRIPRQIRTALITAYHHSELLPLETQRRWEEALQKFRDTRFRLGRLLETRPQEHSVPVAHVFAYLAVDMDDYDLADGFRATLASDSLARISPILDLMLPRRAPETETVSPEHAVATWLYIAGDLDSARKMIPKIGNLSVRTSFLIDLAERTRDLFDAEKALSAFEDLQVWERNDLLQLKPYLQHHINTLKAMVGQIQVSNQPIHSWVEWLARAGSTAPDAELENGLDFLLEQSDERMWEPAEARTISNAVQSIVLDSILTARTVVKQGISTLADHLLLDDQFPRPGHVYVELYEALYTFILEVGRANEPDSKRFIRYAEAILMDDPDRVNGISSQMQDWFASPRQVLVDTHLDALELLCDYGLEGRSLVGHVRQWVAAMLAFTSDLNETSLRSWAEFASSISAGDDIVGALRDHKEVAEGSFADSMARLPERFRIAIFTLRPKSAERVRSMLLEMNPKLDVQISEEKDLSPRVKQLAASADLPVVVTTCITHALTYGISPHLKTEPVRPDSSGSTSIMRAIANRL